MFTPRQLYLIEQCVEAELEQGAQCDTSLTITEGEKGRSSAELHLELTEVSKIAGMALDEREQYRHAMNFIAKCTPDVKTWITTNLVLAYDVVSSEDPVHELLTDKFHGKEE
jgi:hypothetical protein